MMRFLLKIGTLSQAYQTMLPVFLSKRVPLPCASEIRMVLHYAEGPGTFLSQCMQTLCYINIYVQYYYKVLTVRGG